MGILGLLVGRSPNLGKIEQLERERQTLLKERKRLIQEIREIDAELCDVERRLRFLREWDL